MIYKVRKKSLFLLGIIFAAFSGGVGNYVRSNFSKDESSIIARVHADVQGSSCGSGYTQAQCDYWYASGGGSGGSCDEGGQGCCDEGGGADCGGAGGDDGGGDAGGSVICTELHRQGLLSQEIFDADRKFGVVLRQTDPLVYVGYMVWAPHIVSLMKESVVVTKIVEFFASPWTKEMASLSQNIGKGSMFGKILMSFGMPMCKFLGELKIATSDARIVYFHS